MQEFKLAVLRQDEAAQLMALSKCKVFAGFPTELLLEAADLAAELGGRASPACGLAKPCSSACSSSWRV